MKKTRKTEELEGKTREYAEHLLSARLQVKKIEESIKTEKDSYNLSLMNLMNDLNIEKIIGPNSEAQISIKESKKLNHEILLLNLGEFLVSEIGLNKKQVDLLKKNLDGVRLRDIMEKSTDVSVGNPFVAFNEKRNGK